MAAAAPLLERAPNLRDLGGLPTVEGYRVRPGLVYRSEALDALTSADTGRLTRLGIRVACDLRGRDERAHHPSRWPEDARPEVIDLAASTHEIRVDPDHVLGMVARDVDGERTREYMLEAYRAMPDALADAFGPLFDRIARNDLPLLVHCAAGKDRTGFVCAVLLTAIGVSGDAIVEDYLRSRDFVSPERVRLVLQARGLDAHEAAIEAFMVRGEYLAQAVEAVLHRWGSIQTYLAEHAGVSDEAVSAARTVILEPGT